MKKNVYAYFMFPFSLLLLIFLNAYTLFHALSDWTVCLGSIFLFFLFLFSCRFLKNRTDVFLKRFSLSLWFILIVLQILFVLTLHNNIRYDAYWILDQAVEMLTTHQISPTLSNSYFSQVPNNYGLTFITYWFLSILQAVHVPSSCFMRAVQLFNVLFLDLSLLFIYLIIKREKGRTSSTFFLLFCVLTPYPYVWAPYYYTSTTSMLFACASVWIWLVIRRSSSWKKQCILSALLGFLCITGLKVRATSFIAFLAIFLFWSIHHEKGSLKKHLRPILVFLLSTALSFCLWKGIVAHYVPFDTTDTALPITHFVMMGTQGNGSFHMDDLRYSISLPTAEEKRAGTLSVIQERLKSNGIAGNIRLLLSKQLNCWVDGTDDYLSELALCSDFNRLHPYIIGSRSGLLASYAQFVRVAQLLLVCISCFFLLARRKADIRYLLAMNLLGGMAFHLLWETSPLYSIAFSFFSYALAADGMEELVSSHIFQKAFVPYLLTGSSVLLLVSTSAFLFMKKTALTSEPQLVDDFVVNQHMETAGENGPAMELGQIWTQTFEAESGFNVLDLYYGSPNREENTSSYQITLSDESGTVYYDDILYGNKTGYDLAWEIQFEPVIPERKTVYTISILPLTQDSGNYIHFSSQDSSRVDLYSHGALFINGSDTGRDLCFRILNRHYDTCVSKKEYSFLAILLLFLEVLFVFESLRFINQKRRPVT